MAAVRGAGFPLADLVELGDARYASTADALIRADREASAGSDGEAPGSESGRTSSALRAELTAAAGRAEARQRALLIATASRSDFREAVTWQNPAVMEALVATLVDTPPEQTLNRRLRRKLRIVARYLARYCAKNDVIGFFGPAGWAHVDGHATAIQAEPGPALVRWRQVFFEGWAIDRLAERLSSDPSLRWWIAPRQNPAHYRDGQIVYRPHEAPVLLSADDRGVLALCDGDIPACEIAARIQPDRRRDEQVCERLDRLAREGLIIWDLEPDTSLRPEVELRYRISRIGDAALRRMALEPLARLESGRDAVAAARDGNELRERLTELDQTFTRITGSAAVRNAAKTGRTLLYFDSYRDLDMRIGTPLLDALGPPLSLLLLGTRWLGARATETYQDLLLDAYAVAERDAGPAGEVAFADLLERCSPATQLPGNRPTDRLAVEFAQRWEGVLGLSADCRRLDLTVDALAAAVRETFPPSAGRRLFGHRHGVDVQVAADSLAAIKGGEFTLVLGEIHFGWATLDNGVFVNAYPDKAALARLARLGSPPQRIMIKAPKDLPGIAARTISSLDELCGATWLAVGTRPSARGAQVPLGGLVAYRQGDRIRARMRDGSVEFDAVAALETPVTVGLIEAFKLVGRALSHIPRTSVDRLVVKRETWNIELGDFPFGTSMSDHDCFVAARGWASDRGIPRFVFVSVPAGAKPFYVDLTSSCLVAVLADAVRSGLTTTGPSTLATITEMLPAPGQLWLPDAIDRRYTCELRFTAVDPLADANLGKR